MTETQSNPIIIQTETDSPSLNTINNEAASRFGDHVKKKASIIKIHNKRFDSGDFYKEKSLQGKPKPKTIPLPQPQDNS